MKAIDRKLLFHLVDVVWGDAFEDESVPSTVHARRLIQKAIERRREEKYSKQKLNLPFVRVSVCPICKIEHNGDNGWCNDCINKYNQTRGK